MYCISLSLQSSFSAGQVPQALCRQHESDLWSDQTDQGVPHHALQYSRPRPVGKVLKIHIQCREFVLEFWHSFLFTEEAVIYWFEWAIWRDPRCLDESPQHVQHQDSVRHHQDWRTCQVRGRRANKFHGGENNPYPSPNRYECHYDWRESPHFQGYM